MSPWIESSEIAAFNRAPAGARCRLSREFCTVMQCAMAAAQASDGAYDPTIGALVNLWGFGPPGRRSDRPADADIAAAREASGWRRLAFDPGTQTVRQPGGLLLDLSSIAKGFAVDLIVMRLREIGVLNCLVEIGGELRGEGVKPDGNPWWVRLETPAALPDAVIALYGLSVATSGDAHRWFTAGGSRWSHTLDPRTGRPVPETLASVSVLHRSCMEADVLATMLLVLGPEQGYAEAVSRGIAARFVVREGDGFAERLTPALAAMGESTPQGR